MKKTFGSKKAISPVIATVLMILITMTGMTILFVFVSSYSESYKAGIGSSVMESVTIEDIWLSPQKLAYDNTVEISVYNTGKIDSKINSIYANDLNLTAVGSTNFNFNVNIPVGAHLKILAAGSQSWESGRTYTFRIVTQRGSAFVAECTAP